MAVAGMSSLVLRLSEAVKIIVPFFSNPTCRILLAGHNRIFYLSGKIKSQGIHYMTTQKHTLWIRGALGFLATVVLLFTLPAYMNPASNPGLKILSGEAASIGSVAGLFLGRQLTIALIAVYGAIRGTTEPVLIGAFGILAFNLHDAVLLTAYNGLKSGAMIGLVFALLAAAIMWAALPQRPLMNKTKVFKHVTCI